MSAPATPPPAAWQTLAAEDLRALAWLHAEERPPEVLAALYASGFPATLTVVSADAAEAQAMDAALRALASSRCEEDAPDALPASSTDELAADYAAIYLTHALRASPHESVWRDDDHLMLQGPTFAVRDFYRRHGVQVPDWRARADDHLVHELEFVALLLERGDEREGQPAQQHSDHTNRDEYREDLGEGDTLGKSVHQIRHSNARSRAGERWRPSRSRKYALRATMSSDAGAISPTSTALRGRRPVATVSSGAPTKTPRA